MVTSTLEKNPPKKKFWISGLTFANAKKIARYEFGEQMLKVEQNNQNLSFDIYVRGEVDMKKKNRLEATFKGLRVLEVIIKNPNEKKKN